MKEMANGSLIILVGWLLGALGGCTTVSTTPEETIANVQFSSSSSSAPSSGAKIVEYAATVFASDLYESAKASDDKAKAEKAFRSGQALLEIRCGEYLDALGSANQSAANEGRQVGLVGGLASAIMGLTGSDAKSIAISASTFSFAGSSMDAFANSFLFSDASKAITKLVHSAQSAYLTAAQDRMANINYPTAVSLLIGYEQMCRPAQIRAFIDEAVSTARIVSETPISSATEGQILDVLGKLMGALGTPVSEADAIGLYAWFSSDSTGRNNIKPKISIVNALVNSLGSDANLESKLSPVFLPLSIKGNVLSERWSTAVAQVKATAPPAAGQPVPLFSPPVLRVETR